MAVKSVNRKRIELTRKVLFELKHVMSGSEAVAGGSTPGGHGKVGQQHCLWGGTSGLSAPWDAPSHLVTGGGVMDGKGQLDMSWRKVLEGPYLMPWAGGGLGRQRE